MEKSISYHVVFSVKFLQTEMVISIINIQPKTYFYSQKLNITNKAHDLNCYDCMRPVYCRATQNYGHQHRPKKIL